ncbi:hypothetical protein M2451_003366 [Dysgonomonas sp. PFB1-18]|uniref:hypothetical protein n=1 Tax=unclassified Dysgonomonas TaxID=2630389 RepID=UPI0024766F0A|nr:MULTISPECIES: hypothetical protein [unclassified Dysgonomonas]MDH6310544.1 hypothetical protein [Dysgonomonas sp. PF1-14]MDH6340394.1 hypothetical protein [Dysgonomonas sp. PF1-16]MDH6382026.1 hypothetical protein [Dysgonomonas sp. PFB1-18]MDH6399365.1 hypothetical protein [Dysgonomonas sp. PF1-23]
MIPCKHISAVSLFLFITTTNVLGQIPVIKQPQPATLSRGVIIGHPDNQNNNPSSNIPTFPVFNNRNQQQMDMYERDRLEVQRMNALARERADEYLSGNSSIQYDLPSQEGVQGTEHYYQTAEKLLNMLSGKIPLNLKDAVFSVENSFFEGHLDRKRYEERISEMVTIAKSKAIQDRYNWNNPMARNIMFYRVMSDTLNVKLPSQEKSSVSFPMQYDFVDFMGEKNYSNMFVTKLLSSHSGQCHSMPLLYLILCEATGTEASLAFSPRHSYIKFQDKQNNWHNLELTNGKMVTDAFIIGSGFVNAASIKNGIYMQPQGRKQVIAHCLADLASGYVQKYGYDGFVIQCVDSVLAYAPGNTSALAMKNNYLGIRLEYVADQIGRPPLEILKTDYPYVYIMLEERNNFYKVMDESGYVEMPPELYEKWLNSANGEKEKREHDIRYRNIIRLIK